MERQNGEGKAVYYDHIIDDYMSVITASVVRVLTLLLARTYKEKFTQICQQMFEYGLQAHRERQQEQKMFNDDIEAAKLDNRQQAAAKIDDFTVYKQKVSLTLVTRRHLLTSEFTQPFDAHCCHNSSCAK